MASLNRQCSTIKASGERCRGVAVNGEDYCTAHDPARAADRRRNASRAARARHDKEVRTLKEEVKAVISEVRRGELDRADASVMFQGYRALRDYIQLERDASLIPELSERIEELKRERRHAG